MGEAGRGDWWGGRGWEGGEGGEKGEKERGG